MPFFLHHLWCQWVRGFGGLKCMATKMPQNVTNWTPPEMKPNELKPLKNLRWDAGSSRIWEVWDGFKKQHITKK
jgi:hypothetical protein